MLFQLFNSLRGFFTFTASYSNQVFKDPLSKEEEEEKIKKMQEGDITARNDLIEHNLRLVAHIVKKFDYKNVDQDDLISIGTIGLIKGVDSFLTSKGNRLTTYCAKCIQNEILMYFRANNKNNKNISLNEPIGFDKEGNEISIIEIVSDEEKDIVEDCIFDERIACLYKKMGRVLNKREMTVISERYGLFGNDEKTQCELAKELGISRSYVSRIEKKALEKLKKLLEDNHL